jgi:hypothetical protein
MESRVPESVSEIVSGRRSNPQGRMSVRQPWTGPLTTCGVRKRPNERPPARPTQKLGVTSMNWRPHGALSPAKPEELVAVYRPTSTATLRTAIAKAAEFQQPSPGRRFRQPPAPQTAMGGLPSQSAECSFPRRARWRHRGSGRVPLDAAIAHVWAAELPPRDDEQPPERKSVFPLASIG